MIENEDWQLRVFTEWVPKHKVIECTNCLGNGKVSGGFGDLDGPIVCNICHGTGTETIRPKTTPPEIPKDFVEYMRRAIYDYHKNNLLHHLLTNSGFMI